MTPDTYKVMELDESQRAVAEADADARLLVTAGAGQGKTEVVASRIQYLVEEKELSASTEIMVLSFSRAAVQAVRSRLDAREIARTDVRTFDSFASYLLSQNDIEPVGSYDNRVRHATGLLTRSHDIDGIEELAHVVLDEVQDLVGDRAEMVLALLRRLDESAGFTALGDPLQAIYDFTLADSRSKMTSGEFADRLIKEFGASSATLQRNYRARGKFPRDVIGLGNVIRDEAEVDASRTMTDFENTLPHTGEIKNWEFLTGNTGRTAILCLSNGEALRISRFLSEQCVDHVVRRPAQDFGAARWIAEVFSGMAGPDVARADVESVIETKLSERLRDEAWYLLKGAEGSNRMNQLNLSRLRSMITAGSIPLTLTEPDRASVIVSTIHRAKGLEFERAYFVHPNHPVGDQREWPALRQKYVALSRARDDIAVLDIPESKGFSWFEARNGRQRERRKSKQGKKYTAAIEFGAKDVCDSAPVGGAARAAEIQRNLIEVRPGESVTGTFEPDHSTDDEPVFVLRSRDGREIGTTSKRFGQAIAYDFGYWFRDGWEGVGIEGLRLVSVETVAGDPRLTEQSKLGSSGFWLVPRVFGLITPRSP